MRAGLVTTSALVVGILLMSGCAADEQTEAPTVGPTGDQSTVMSQTDAPMVDMPADEGVEPMGLNEAPEGWPATVPVPVDGLLQAWTEVDGDIDATWLLRETDVDRAGSQYAEVVTAAGWQGSVGGTFTLDAATITITVSPGPESGDVYVTVKHEQG